MFPNLEFLAMGMYEDNSGYDAQFGLYNSLDLDVLENVWLEENPSHTTNFSMFLEA